MNLGQMLCKLRNEKGIYQKELAAYLQVSIGTISNYEKGIHYPDPETLCQLADYYNVTTDYLLGRTDYSHDFDEMNQNFISDYTVADFLNTAIELPKDDRSRIADYVELLKIRNERDRKEEKEREKEG